MTRAYVYTMLPSLMTSFKISSMGETIGTMQQDRATAIAGTLGKGPALVPMTVTLQSDRGDAVPDRRASLKYQLVNDQLFTPLLAYVALFNTLGVVRAAVRRRDVLASRAARSSRATATWPSRTSSPARTRCSAPRRPSPDRSTMLLANDIETVTVEGARRDRSPRPRRRARRASSACGSTTSGRAPAARCR